MADSIVQTLTVPFAAGFVVQRFLEIVDPLISRWFKDPNTKKICLGLVSLGIGFCLACGLHLRIFHALLQYDCDEALWNFADFFATAVFISAGTEGFNSLMKFASYKKEASKADAANKLAAAGDAIKTVNPQK